MPVRKYRDVSEMPDDPWKEPGDPARYSTRHPTVRIERSGL